MKIRPVWAELFHADGQTDRHDDANSRFSQFRETPYKRITISSREPTQRPFVWRVSQLHSHRTKLQYFSRFWYPKSTLPNYHTGK